MHQRVQTEKLKSFTLRVNHISLQSAAIFDFTTAGCIQDLSSTLYVLVSMDADVPRPMYGSSL